MEQAIQALYQTVLRFREAEERRKTDASLFEEDQFHAAGAAAAYSNVLEELRREFPTLAFS